MKIKRLLLVIKDHLEFRFIMNDYFLTPFFRKFDVTLMCPENSDKFFRASVSSKFPKIKFLNLWPEKEICLKDKIIYWAKSEAFFILNAYKSESCFQKVFLNLELPLRQILKKVQIKNLIILFSPFFNNDVLENLLKIFIFPIFSILLLFRTYIYSHRRFFSKLDLYEKINFDYILWGRPYSIANIPIYNTFTHSNTKIITICRNFDTPALKGIFTIPSHFTIVFDKILYNHLATLNCPLNFGKAILYEHPIRSYRRGLNKENEKVKNILYATISPWFIPDEDKIVERLYNLFAEEMKEEFTLFLRIHQDDDIERYKKIYMHKNIALEKKFYKQDFKTFSGRRECFPTPDEIEVFYDRLQNMDIVFSSGSTINYEALLLGVKTVFLKPIDSINWIFKRDHLKILTEEYKIPIFENIEDVRKYLKHLAQRNHQNV